MDKALLVGLQIAFNHLKIIKNTGENMDIDKDFMLNTLLMTTGCGIAGYIYGECAKVSPLLTASILTIASLANTALALAILDQGKEYKECLNYYTKTQTVVVALTIVALRQFKLIANPQTLVLTGLAGLNFARLHYDAHRANQEASD